MATATQAARQDLRCLPEAVDAAAAVADESNASDEHPRGA